MKRTFILTTLLSLSISGITQDNLDFNISEVTPSIEIKANLPVLEENLLLSSLETPKWADKTIIQKPNNQCLQLDLIENEPTRKLDNKQFQLTNEPQGLFRNRRNTYSSLWTFASLNYLYADLVGLMDHNLLNQYLTGTVEGLDLTPKFLTGAAAFMQIPIANVFLPQVIKNERTLRWVQIISGSVMTLVQGATLFVGTPSPYYTLFSTFEMAATTFITIDAIKWKPQKRPVINTNL